MEDLANGVKPNCNLVEGLRSLFFTEVFENFSRLCLFWNPVFAPLGVTFKTGSVTFTIFALEVATDGIVF